MHKRNVTLIALCVAAIISGLFLVFSELNHSTVLGVFYFPAILLSVIFSGGSHSPSEVAGWSAFLSYTIVYLLVFVVTYAILLEYYLLRRIFHHIDAVEEDLKRGESEPTAYLNRIGTALAELETRRRRHWVLENIEEINLSHPPHLIAAHAIAKAGQKRSVRVVLKRMESHLTHAKGEADGKELMKRIHETAHKLV